jgi:cell division protein FtsB
VLTVFRKSEKDVSILKQDVSELKTDVAELKTDVAELKEGQRRIEKKFV